MTGIHHVSLSIYDHAGNPHYGGGGAAVVHAIAVRLLRDHRVTVYCGSYPGSGRGGTRDGVRYVFLPVGWAGPRAGQLLFQLLVPIVALFRRPDLWIESLTPPFSASPLPVLYRRPVIALVQMLTAADMARRYRLPFPLVERYALRLYRRFVVLNETDASAVAACAPRARVTLIPNGIDAPPPGDRTERHILVLGRIDIRQKGLDLLLSALDRRNPGLPVVIAGSGARAEVRKLTEAVRGARAPITLAGRVAGAEKDRLLRDAAFVVVPSRFETFSLTALEAMAYGKPVICFDLPRLAWIRPDCAVRVPPFEVAALADAIAALATDPDRRAALGRRALEVSRAYDWEVIGDRYRELVAGALTGS